ncbi:MAG: flavodoxin family protein [Candidatus Omnitrophica bacterium]|nr:flavodoxin family protein [Candidatus Omnitrophota bacterium]
MSKNILVVSGSPKREGNTATLVSWFADGARAKGANVAVVSAAFLKYKSVGCLSCRSCQTAEKYECVINDDGRKVLNRMAEVDVIVMATPLYFYGPSAQLKVIFDRMFSLYKWDNAAGTMKTPLKGKTFVLIGSAFEDEGLEAFEKPFSLTASYTGMVFESLLVPNAGVSGEVKNVSGARDKAFALGQTVA